MVLQSGIEIVLPLKALPMGISSSILTGNPACLVLGVRPVLLIRVTGHRVLSQWGRSLINVVMHQSPRLPLPHLLGCIFPFLFVEFFVYFDMSFIEYIY